MKAGHWRLLLPGSTFRQLFQAGKHHPVSCLDRSLTCQELPMIASKTGLADRPIIESLEDIDAISFNSHCLAEADIKFSKEIR